MGRPRFPLILLMAASAVLALDMAVIRSLNRPIPGSNGLLYLVPIDGTSWMPFSALAYGVLPMASLLVLVAASQFMASGPQATSRPARSASSPSEACRSSSSRAALALAAGDPGLSAEHLGDDLPGDPVHRRE